MSRMYDNRPLQSLAVTTHDWKGIWQPERWQSGEGVLLEGSIEARSRHVIADVSQQKHRYFVLHVKVERAHKRKFDASGTEIEPNFSETEKVRTGHLHSSYKVEAKGQTDRLSDEAVSDMLIESELTSITSAAAKPGCIPLWIKESQLQGIDLTEGDRIRLKTMGDGPFIASLGKLDSHSATVGNFAGGSQVGASWTDKVMAVKASQDGEDESGQGQGAEDHEWDD